jgi:hypothetical protein
MRELVWIFVTVSGPENAATRQAFEQAGWPLPEVEPLLGRYRYHVKLDVSDPRLAAVRARLTDTGIAWAERHEAEYEENELRSSALLTLLVDSAPKGEGGPEYGTEYDLSSACSACGAGAVQVGPLHFNPSGLRTKSELIETGAGEHLLGAEAASLLRACDFTGLELRQVVSSTNGEPLPWYQIIAATELPPWSPRTRGVKTVRPCAVCHRDGRFHNEREGLFTLAYEFTEAEFASVPDVSHTFERFGWGGLVEPFRGSTIARASLIVRPEVYSFFSARRTRNLEFIPVDVTIM